MNWNLQNARSKEENKEYDLFTPEKFVIDVIQKPKRLNPIYELRKEISNLVERPILQILGQTKGMSYEQLNAILVDAKNDAIKFKINVGSRIWNLIKESRIKNKK